ncbi:T9SS type A sorting domain-containing protein [Flavobacterium ovatum]|uniref:Ig-like domain-containing protein n=1 Tax=Flavobacterium ovatum TaxID=1928857 RepID=UPI0034508B1A
MKKIIILFTLLVITGSLNAQTISRKVVSSAGGTLSGGGGQLTFSIGETFIPSLTANGDVVTHGFQQPGEKISTGNVSNTTMCPGNNFNLPYTARDIGGANTFTAQLSNASGSFASPVNIGTLTGNSSTGEINVTIPYTTVVGTGYRIRITSSVPAFIGTDNGANIIINELQLTTISYSSNIFCASNNASVTRSGLSGGTYSSTAGISINSNTGTINLSGSIPGSYTVSYSYSNSVCSGIATANVTIIAIPTEPVVAAQNFCNSATVAALPNGGGAYKWYSSSNNGTELPSTTVLSTGKYYVSNTSGNCESTRTSVNITIINVSAPSVAAQNFCSSATVALLPNGGGTYKWYSSAVGGTVLSNSTNLSSGTYYVSDTSGGCESNRTGVSVTINPNVSAGTVSGPTTLCVGATDTFTSNGPQGGSWSSTNTSAVKVNAKTGVVTTVNAGNAIIQYTVTSGCGSPVTSSSAAVTVSAPPTASINYNGTFCNTGFVNVTRTGQAGGVYSASPSGLNINSSTGRVNLGASSTGNYTVTYSFSSGNCSDVTTTKIKISNCKKDTSEASEAAISLKPTLDTTPVKFDVIAYPNPSAYQFNLVVESDSSEKINVYVYEMSGKLLKHLVRDIGESIVFGSELPTGVYTVLINQGPYQKTVRLIKQ